MTDAAATAGAQPSDGRHASAAVDPAQVGPVRVGPAQSTDAKTDGPTTEAPPDAPTGKMPRKTASSARTKPAKAAVHLYGIRHHGPGSARSLLTALQALAPDCVLIEGPPDADALIPLAAAEGMEPPVALLVYKADEPRLASFYPLAAFSPEWVAIRHGLATNAAVRFMDLPQALHLAPEAPPPVPSGGTPNTPGNAPATIGPDAADTGQVASASADTTQAAPAQAATAQADVAQAASATTDPSTAPTDASAPGDDSTPASDLAAAVPPADSDALVPPDTSPATASTDLGGAARARHDPLGLLARLSETGGDGVEAFETGERWWDGLVESRAHRGEDVFAAVAEAMAAVRAAMPDTGAEAARDERREAWMRTTIRTAAREGYARIAVVCGAWHLPALHLHDAPGQAGRDAATLKGLPRVKTEATWAPWSYERLSAGSGYGAGVLSPEWYDLVWHAEDEASGDGGVAARWMTRTARLLRDEDLDASPASVIEAVRLADALATMRGRSRPGLEDLQEACLGALLAADPAPMALIRRKLIVGDRLGRVPEGAPQTPVQADLTAQARRLRLPLQSGARPLELDLRGDTDLARSVLLHRLRLLDVPWGTPARSRGGRGTFREEWVLDWLPEHAIALIAASRMGATVQDAAAAQASAHAAEGGGVAALSALVGTVLAADLPTAAEAVLRALADGAAVASDVFELMDALPPLAELARYGSVRGGGGAGPVGDIVAGIVPRVAAGLVPACLSLDDEAASAAKGRLDRVAQAVALLEQPALVQEWTAALSRLAGQDAVHGLVVGRATRLLLDGRHLTGEQAGGRLGLALSHAAAPAAAAAWIEGFLAGSGAVLLHDASLLGILDAWLAGLAPDRFTETLPLLRRTLSSFPAGERRIIGERLRGAPATCGPAEGFDPARAARVIPVLRLLLGAAP